MTPSKALTLRRLSESPALDGTTPGDPKISPDGKLVSYLRGRAENQYCYDLWVQSVSSGERKLLVSSDVLVDPEVDLSEEEKARRERQRVYGHGIMEYYWSPDGQSILLPASGKLFLFSIAQQSVALLLTKGFVTDPKFSPDGTYVSYISEQNLYVLKLGAGATEQPVALTIDGGGAVKNGMAEFVAQEEMDRYTGYWWSPNEACIAYTRVDESRIEQVKRNEIYASHTKVVDQRYPFTGKDNAEVKLGVVFLKDRQTKWVNLGPETDMYLPRVNWATEKLLSFQWQARNQKELCLRLVNLDDLESPVTVCVERDEAWVNLHSDLYYLRRSQGILWASERSGFKHLYVLDMKGQLKTQLTEGEWPVDSVQHVDESKGYVYFLANKDSAVEMHLYRVSLSGGDIEKVSRRPGCHATTFATNDCVYLDTFSSTMQPPQLSLHDGAGDIILWIEENKVTPSHPLYPYFDAWICPEFGHLAAEDGQTLHFRLYKPVGFDENKTYPVIVRVYGGPGAQLVVNSWRATDQFTQYLLQEGYVVFQLDNRGSAHRGRRFEKPIYGHLGQVEVEDQKRGVEFLRSLSYVDNNNIGIYGHSYGGYMSLMCIFKAGTHFRAAIAGAPVTEWRLYDTHYTERFLMTPKVNEKGYNASSVFPHIKSYKNGSLLVYHGMADDNVLFENSTKLYKALQDQGKVFEMMDYPGSKHSMRGASVGIHLYTTIIDFFNRKLKAQGSL